MAGSTSPDPTETALRRLQDAIRACRACGFVHNPRPVVEGPAGVRIMVVGQAPGRTEEAVGRPWWGPAGKRLTAWMVERVGFADAATFRRQVYFAAIARCFPGPGRGGKGDAKPGPATVEACGRHLDAEMALLRPRVLVLVGRMAIDRFLKAPDRPLEDLVGRLWPGEVAGRAVWFCPLPHPSGASTWLNDPGHRARLDAGLAALGALIRAEGLADLG